MASYNGHIKVVRFLIENKADVNLQNTDGYSPLHIASQHGHFAVVDLLIANNANVNLSNEGITPLHLACMPATPRWSSC